MRSEKQILEERATVFTEMEGYLKKAQDEKRAFTTDEEAFFQKADSKYNELTVERNALVSTNGAVAKMEEYRAENEKATVSPIITNAPVTATKGVDVRSSLTHWMKYGKGALSQEQRNVLQPLEYRGTATQVTTNDPLGGYLVPEDWAAELYHEMLWYGGALQAARIFNTATGGPFHKPKVQDTANVGAIIAQGVADIVSDVTHAEVIWNDFTYTSKVMKWSIEEMQDSKYNVDAEVREVAAARLGRILNTHFTTGDNSGKPHGLVPGSGLGRTTTAGTAFTRAEVLDLIHSVDPSHRQGPKVGFMFHDKTLASLKKLAFGSGDDRPLWQPSIREGEPDRLEGFPYWVNNDMAIIALAAKIMLFGNFDKYHIRQIGGYNLVRSTERWVEERVVAFFMYARFDGRYLDANAVKHLIMAAA